jgi:hypothetical protein
MALRPPLCFFPLVGVRNLSYIDPQSEKQQRRDPVECGGGFASAALVSPFFLGWQTCPKSAFVLRFSELSLGDSLQGMGNSAGTLIECR